MRKREREREKEREKERKRESRSFCILLVRADLHDNDAVLVRSDDSENGVEK